MSVDWAILNWIQQYMKCDFLDFLMPKITVLGDVGIIWILIAIVLMYKKQYRRYGIILIIGLAIGVVVGNLFLKNLIARPRPCWIDTSVALLIDSPKDYSFPSGHTLTSVTSAFILTKANHKFGYVAILLASLIAFSRMYLYLHFPSDVLAGILIGLIVGVLTFYIGNRVLPVTAEL